MANFIGLVYATLKNEGIDTKGMSTDEAVKKYNELQEKSGGKAGEKEATPAENKKLAEKEPEKKEKGILDEKQLKLLPKMKTEHIKESIEWFEGLYEKHKDKESGKQIKRFIDAFKEELNKRKTVEDKINYDTVRYPAEEKRIKELGISESETKSNLQKQYKDKFKEYQKVVDYASNLKTNIPAGLEDEIKREEEFIKKYPNDEMTKYISDKLNTHKEYLLNLQKEQEKNKPKIEKLNKEAERIKNELNDIRKTARDKGFGELTGYYGDYD